VTDETLILSQQRDDAAAAERRGWSAGGDDGVAVTVVRRLSTAMSLFRSQQHRQLSPRRCRPAAFAAATRRNRYRRRPKPHLSSL